MYQVIARKYRPQSFAELIGQEHVRATIENAIAQDRIAHGYIFAGQRGTGKTTVARILARCLNCEKGPTAQPCGVCSSCREISGGNALDVIEIDAASNRGINEIRELRENVRFRPARDRYKVFIIDEAHQITTEAFNALLKTLEEPPEWAVFVLCTTEAHKIPTTVASRCQQFSFRSVDFAEVVQRMEWICGQEGIEADGETLSALAQAGEGSVRDSLSALDQAIACCGNRLMAAEVRNLLGMFSLDSLGQVSRALVSNDSRAMLEMVLELERNGRSLQHFCRELSRYFRNLLVIKIAGPNTRLVAATEAEQQQLAATGGAFSEEDLTRYLQLTLDLFKDLQFSLQPRLHLEIGLLRLLHAGRLTAIEEALASLPGAGGNTQLKTTPKAPERAAPQATPPAAPPPPKPAPVRSGPSPFEQDTARKTSAPDAPADPASITDWRQAIHDALVELQMQFTADTVSEAEVTEAKGELRFVIPAGMLLDEKDVQKAVQKVAGRPMRIAITTGTPQTGAPARSAATAAGKPQEDETAQRALAHPDVKRFQELFPDAHVRTVRNLKE